METHDIKFINNRAINHFASFDYTLRVKSLGRGGGIYTVVEVGGRGVVKGYRKSYTFCRLTNLGKECLTNRFVHYKLMKIFGSFSRVDAIFLFDSILQV